MTRKQLITACVENQIERGIVKKENKKMQINIRLNGGHSGQKPMLKAECQRWYNDLFELEKEKEKTEQIKSNQNLERKEEKKMTKKQIIEKCVEEEIKREKTKKENKEKEETEIIKFEKGKKYVCSSVINSNSRYKFEVIKRTKKNITIKNNNGELKRCKIHTNQEKTVELIYPNGKYSMCLVLSASDIQEQQQQEEQVIQSKNSFWINTYKEIYKEIDYKNYEGRFSKEGIQAAICYLELLDKFQRKACDNDIKFCEMLSQWGKVPSEMAQPEETDIQTHNIDNVIYIDFRKKV